MRSNVLMPIGTKVKLKSMPRMPRPTWGLELEVLGAREDTLTQEKLYEFEHDGSRGEVNEDYILSILSVPQGWHVARVGGHYHLSKIGAGGGWTSPVAPGSQVLIIGAGGGGGSGRSRGSRGGWGPEREKLPETPQAMTVVQKTALEEWCERNPGYDPQAMARMGRNWWE